MCIKNYFALKNIGIIFGVMIFMSVMNNDPYACVVYGLVMGNIFCSYPFVLGETCDINIFYQTLPINRREAVIGRYVFNLLVLGLFGMAISIFSYLYFNFFTSKGILLSELVSAFLSAFAVLYFVQAIQIPLFFKLGYGKARILSYLPFLLIGLIGFVVIKYGDIKKIIALSNSVSLIVIAGILFITSIFISISYSIKVYRNKDF